MPSAEPTNKECPFPKPGEPALHRAAREGDHAAIRLLAATGVNLNEVFDIDLDPCRPRRFATPLMVAAGSGDGATDETAALLVGLGADPTVMLEGDSAASFAAVGLGRNYNPGGDAARLRFAIDAGSPLPTDPDVANRLLCDTVATGDPNRANPVGARSERAWSLGSGEGSGPLWSLDGTGSPVRCQPPRNHGFHTR